MIKSRYQETACLGWQATGYAARIKDNVSMAAQPPIRVMIVDDHEMVRDGLAVLVDGFDDLALVGEASNGAEAVELFSRVKPDVILMDLSMPKMDGIATTKVLRENHPDIKIIALTSSQDSERQRLATQAGATKFLLKNASVVEIEEAIRSVVLLERDHVDG
jgi:NarL family two-component system response regulator LiaR